MRLPEVERGDRLRWRLLIQFISLMSGMRLPDAARIVFYHKEFFGDPLSLWTHMAMRGASEWTVGERELMAAMTANWNACAFCVGAHGAIAARVLGRPTVDLALAGAGRTELPPGLPARLRATVAFLEDLTRTPDTMTAHDAQTVLRQGITPEALEDAIAATALFNIIGRCADALRYDMPSARDFDRAAKRLLAQGYAIGKGSGWGPRRRRGVGGAAGRTPAHPDHRALADALYQRVQRGPGQTDVALRQAMAQRASGGPAVAAPYDDLARQIGVAAYKVTDEQVARVVDAAGSQRATFELVAAAAVGAGLHRWRRGLDVLDEAAARPRVR